jgi:DNA processing protein
MSIAQTLDKNMSMAYIPDKEAIFRHILIKGGFDSTFIHTICRLFDSVDAFWNSPKKQWQNILKNETLEKFQNIKTTSNIDTEFSLLIEQGINLVIPEQQEYPKLLKEVYMPPKLLYYRGNINKLNKDFSMSIVGSRKTSAYGKAAVAEIVRGLAHKNINIISGLALGADACAHENALRNNLYTAAVLGSGIIDANIFPRANYHLAQRILESGGCIISEYPPDAPAYPSNFPARNRIIAGLAKAILVSEATNGSGSLITAHIGLEENRDIWAIPGQIFDALSVGTNRLIYKGARPAINAKVIFEEYFGLEEEKSQKEKETTKPSLFSDSIEEQILKLLQKNKMDIEEIFSSVNAPSGEINQALTSLEISDKIIIESGLVFARHLTKLKNDE